MAALRPHRVNLGLNLLGWHWLAREGVQLLQHPAQILSGTLAAKLLIQQFTLDKPEFQVYRRFERQVIPLIALD